MFGIPEVRLTEPQVVQIHGKTIGLQKVFQSGFIQVLETIQCGNGSRQLIIGVQGFHRFQRSFPTFYGVDEIVLDFFEIRIGQIAGQDINLCGTYSAAFTAQHDLQALFTAVCTLVKLSRQIFSCKIALVVPISWQIGVNVVDRRFGENSRNGFLKCFFADMIHIITVHDAYIKNVASQCSL